MVLHHSDRKQMITWVILDFVRLKTIRVGEIESKWRERVSREFPLGPRIQLCLTLALPKYRNQRILRWLMLCRGVLWLVTKECLLMSKSLSLTCLLTHAGNVWSTQTLHTYLWKE